MSTKFKDSKLHEKRRRLNYETPSFYYNVAKVFVTQKLYLKRNGY